MRLYALLIATLFFLGAVYPQPAKASFADDHPKLAAFGRGTKRALKAPLILTARAGTVICAAGAFAWAYVDVVILDDDFGLDKTGDAGDAYLYKHKRTAP